MKKLLNKVFKSGAKPPETGGRITNETVAEHRERVLAGGRKFKYPLQYTKHRVLIISIIIGVFALIVFVVFFVWQLYFAQAYDKFTYGLTRVLPVPVAKVDTELVRYSDYLSELRSGVHYLTTKEAINFNSADGRRQLDDQKRQALDKAVSDAYISRLAADNKVNVSSKEVDNFIDAQIVFNKLKRSDYERVISDYYDFSFDEYRSSVHKQLLNKKVNAALDKDARAKIEQALGQIAAGTAFAEVAKSQSDDVSKVNGGDVGFVSKSSLDPSGLIAAAAALQPGQVSPIIEGVDGFYLVRLIEKRDTGDVHFAKILVSYKLAVQKLAELKKDGKITEYIKVEQAANPITN